MCDIFFKPHPRSAKKRKKNSLFTNLLSFITREKPKKLSFSLLLFNVVSKHAIF